MSGQLRIIGGEWRGRMIKFPTRCPIRPTTDLVRETLFNWLAADIREARCLDLFAGSGALGLEALSRGANHVVFVDAEPRALSMVRNNFNLLAPEQSSRATFIRTKIPAVKFPNVDPFSIVFIDPPYQQGLVARSILWLERNNLLLPNALVYIETEKECDIKFPLHWQVLREKKSGNIKYYLVQVQRLPPPCIGHE